MFQSTINNKLLLPALMSALLVSISWLDTNTALAQNGDDKVNEISCAIASAYIDTGLAIAESAPGSEAELDFELLQATAAFEKKEKEYVLADGKTKAIWDGLRRLKAPFDGHAGNIACLIDLTMEYFKCLKEMACSPADNNFEKSVLQCTLKIATSLPRSCRQLGGN